MRFIAPLRFQSTRPRGARRPVHKRKHLSTTFQSTRPRGARRIVNSRRTKGWNVSIHAPAGGATPTVFCLFRRSPCFNPRARGGRDFQTPWKASGNSRFNPRARGGRDTFPLRYFRYAAAFQSTRPRGARPSFGSGTRKDCPFQSTRPRGARL